MPDCWVVNASPVIALAKVGHLDLLDADAPCIVLPQSVADEIRHGPDGDPARQALDNGWGGNPVTAAPDPLVVEWGLGAGETAVLSIARRKNALAVIDDGAARSAARAIGIASIGTLGIVLRARRANRNHPQWICSGSCGERVSDSATKSSGKPLPGQPTKYGPDLCLRTSALLALRAVRASFATGANASKGFPDAWGRTYALDIV